MCVHYKRKLLELWRKNFLVNRGATLGLMNIQARGKGLNIVVFWHMDLKKLKITRCKWWWPLPWLSVASNVYNSWATPPAGPTHHRVLQHNVLAVESSKVRTCIDDILDCDIQSMVTRYRVDWSVPEQTDSAAQVISGPYLRNILPQDDDVFTWHIDPYSFLINDSDAQMHMATHITLALCLVIYN